MGIDDEITSEKKYSSLTRTEMIMGKNILII